MSSGYRLLFLAWFMVLLFRENVSGAMLWLMVFVWFAAD